MVRVLLVRPRGHVEQSGVAIDDERLSVRTAVPEATATAVLVEQPDVVGVPVDETGLDTLRRVRDEVEATPVVALATGRAHSVLCEAIEAGAADAISFESAGSEAFVDRLVYVCKRHEAALDGREAASRTAPHRTAEPVAMLESDGTIVDTSAPFEAVLGRSFDSGEGRSLVDFLADESGATRDGVAALDPEQRQTDWTHLSVPVARPDGSRGQLSGALVRAHDGAVRADENHAVFALYVGRPAASDATVSPQSSPRRGVPPTAVSPDGRPDATFEQLLETTEELMAARTPAAVAAALATTAASLLDCDGAVARLHDDGVLRTAATSGTAFEECSPPAALAVGEGPAGTAFERGEPVREEWSPAGSEDSVARSESRVRAVPIDQHGTVSVVASRDARLDDCHLQELLAAIAATALARTDRAQRIHGLLERTESLLDAETPTAVCDRTLDAVRELIGDEAIGVYLFDDGSAALEPVVWSDRTEQLLGDPPSIPRGRGVVWDAFEDGTLRSYDDVTAEQTPLNADTSVRSEIHVPLGEHGVVIVGSPAPGVYDDVDEQLLELLGVNVARTLDRVHRQQELREYEAAFEAVGHMLVLCDEDGTITHATEPLAAEIGRSRADLVGESVLDHFDAGDGGTIQSALHRAADAGSTDASTDAVADDAADTLDTQLRTTADEPIPVTLEFDPLPDLGRRTLLTVHDRSELVEKQSQLARERDRFSYLFDHLPDPVVEVELGETGPLVTSANSAFGDIFGYDPDAIAGQPLNDIIVPEEERDRAQRLDERALNGHVNIREVERLTDSGRRQFLFRGIPYELDDSDEIYGFGIYTDITEQKERQQHLEVIHRVLRHNLRNDINVVLGGLDVLEPAIEGQRAEFLEDLRSTAQGLVRMSHKAKELAAAIDLGTDDCDPVDLERLVESVLDAARDRYDDVTFETELHTHVVQGNPNVLSSAVLELVENAVEHGEADRVHIDVTADTDAVRLQVADDGPGIPEYERDVVTDGTITPLQHGSGLGLWLVRRAAESCGGTVSFDEDGPLSGGTVAIELHPTTSEGDHDPSGEQGAQTS
jgi:PAS domain S-box-containing protein